METTYVTEERKDTPNDRGLIGKVGDVIRVVRFTNHLDVGSNAFVARYEWVEKTLHSTEKFNDYVRGGWFPLRHKFTVGLWSMVYCGPERVDPASVCNLC